ncbi:ATP binding [Pristimantis euphronides]
MRPICTVVDGLPSEGTSFPGPISVFEMSMLRALDPVQTWLGQELEKCGIDAMIYTRYVLSLLLHDSYDYDLQEQENDIFAGWEKGACKKWGKGKKKSSDLSMEEMKKQAAVQCLLSASDESSGIETLVEELCSKLKDLQSSEGDRLPTSKEDKTKKVDGSLSPEDTSSPARKDQAEMYYEAFPPLSEKPICLQEIMTVWNKSKICSYSSSSSSSTAPQTSTETPSPKNCHSESEAVATNKSNGASNTVQGKNQQRKGKNEKENKSSNGAVDERTNISKSVRHKSNGKIRPRSWSSGSSEAGSSSSGNRGELKTRYIKLRHKVREVRNKKGKTGPKVPSKNGERKNVAAASGAASMKPICKRVKRQVKEYAYKEMDKKGDVFKERRHETEFREEPLWYTEPITEYFIPLNSKSKLETTYRKNGNRYSASEDVEELSEFVKGLHLNNHNIHETYLAAGTFIEGHFVEMPAVVTETSDHTGTSKCSLLEDNYLDDVHPVELTHFYEVEIDQSMLDPGASEKTKGESRILNMIRQQSNITSDIEAESCKVLDDNELQGESAIWTESTSSIGAEGFFLQDHRKLAQFWESCSPSSSADADGESLGGDSPSTFSPFFDSTKLNTHMHAGNQDLFFDGKNSYFSVFEVECGNSVFSLPRESMFNEKVESSSSMNGFGKTQSRLLIWTKNSAFDENEQCSNLSTRTCSPWSHSDGTRSDTEALNSHLEDYAQLNMENPNYNIPTVTLTFQDDMPGMKSQSSFLQNRTLGDEPALVLGKKSKLESLCGIQLEQEKEEIPDATELEPASNIHTHGYSSGVIKDLWTNVEDQLFPLDVNTFSCHDANDTDEASFQEPSKAVQRSEYHLWESQRNPAEKRAFLACDSKVDGGDYMTPSKPWDINHVKENSFILGGVYGEFGNFNGEDEWAVVPQSPAKASLLDCASSDVVTIAGTDVFMSPGNSIAPGHRQLWRPFVSFEENEQNGDKGSSKGFSFILHEDLLGTCDTFQVEEPPGMGYSFSSFELNNRFSQVLHVECSFEPGNIVTSSPTSFKPKALCSDSEGDISHPRICGVERTQYRSIRISPRTHFRPISASELSPGAGSESDFESEKDEVGVPTLSESEVLEDPQDDLKPLEEDAEKESNFYGKSELESGKFLPRLQKSGMEKSAQTSLDGQEESIAVLPQEKPDHLDFRIIESFESDVMQNSKKSCKTLEVKSKADVTENLDAGCDPTSEELGEYPPLSINLQGINAVNEKQCWWQKALYSPLISGSCCDPLYTDVKEESCEDHTGGKDLPCAGWHPLEIEKTSACNQANITIGFGGGVTSSCFRKKLYSSDSSSSDTASEGGHDWADICREELFSRTQL